MEQARKILMLKSYAPATKLWQRVKCVILLILYNEIMWKKFSYPTIVHRDYILKVTFICVCVGIENRESSLQVKGKSSNVMLNAKHLGNQTHIRGLHIHYKLHSNSAKFIHIQFY